MRKKLLGAVALFLTCGLSLSQMVSAGPQITEDNPAVKEGWNLVFQDEFEGNVIDQSKWNVFDPNLTSEDYYYYANSPETIVCPENVYQSDGYLKIKAENKPMIFNGVEHKYRTGTLQSRGKVELTYGLYEAKILMPDLPGSNPAFWLMPHHDGKSYSFIGLGGTGAEVDILEHLYDDKSNYQATVHWGGYDEHHKSWTASPKPYMGDMQNWHTFAVDWGPTYLKFMVDGKVTATYTGEAVPYGPEFIILSLGMGGWIGQPDESRMPANMLVDYVRVYEKATDLADGTYTIQSELSGKYLDLASNTEGAFVVQNTLNDHLTQQWIIEKQMDGFYKIKNAATGMLLDVFGRQTDDGVNIIQWYDTGNKNQQWDLMLNSAGSRTMVNRDSRKVVDVFGRQIEDGVPIIQYSHQDRDNQHWIFTPTVKQ